MTVALAVDDSTYVAGARRQVETMAQKIGLGGQDVSRATLVASELATNLALHGGGGQLLARAVRLPTVAGIELVAVDRGRGMRDVSESLRDGVSTRGTSGTGLGAVRRQSDEFDIFSSPKQGTAVLSRIWPGRKVPPAIGVKVGVVNVAKPGEEVCGDSWAVQVGQGQASAMIADDLGHGPLANQAAEAARRLFVQIGALPPVNIVQRLHAGLQATRGAAIGILSVDLVGNKAAFAGIGNIAGLLTAGGQIKRFVSMNGIAGHAAERFQEFLYPCDGPGLAIVLHSDGLSTNWSLDRYVGLAGRDPSLIAAVLYRDTCRGRDDATVLVMKRAT